MEESNKKIRNKTDEPVGEMIKEISSGIRRIEIQNDVLRKLIDELSKKTKKKPL